MVNNPYQVLGISQGASADEIKKAYRKKAKECHPDLHPNDPHAQEKMNEVNEAYDMLCNPEKYQNRQTQSGQSSSYGSSNTYSSGYNQSGSYNQSGYYNQSSSYGSQGSQSYRNSYGGPGGWSSAGFGPFGFYSFFDMFGQEDVDTTPRHQQGDSADISYVIDCLNSRRYQDALSKLVRIPSTQRNARWFYLSAIANYGSGNSVRASEHIKRALEMSPNDPVYRSLYRKISNGAQYSQTGNSGSYGSHSSQQSNQRQNYKVFNPLGSLLRFIFIIMIIRFIGNFLRFFLYGGGMFIR